MPVSSQVSAARIGIPPPVKASGSGSNLTAGHHVLSLRAAIGSAARRSSGYPGPDDSFRISSLSYVRCSCLRSQFAAVLPWKNAISLPIKYICSPQHQRRDDHAAPVFRRRDVSQLESTHSKGECTHELELATGKSLRRLTSRPANMTDEKLRALIDQATGDSVDESDEHAGLLSVIREEVVCPFPRSGRRRRRRLHPVRMAQERLRPERRVQVQEQDTRGRHQCRRMDRAASQGPRMDRRLLRLARPPRLTDPQLTRSFQARHTAGDRFW